MDEQPGFSPKHELMNDAVIRLNETVRPRFEVVNDAVVCLNESLRPQFEVMNNRQSHASC